MNYWFCVIQNLAFLGGGGDGDEELDKGESIDSVKWEVTFLVKFGLHC